MSDLTPVNAYIAWQIWIAANHFGAVKGSFDPSICSLFFVIGNFISFIVSH